MKNKFFRVGLCLCSLLGMQLQAANQNSTSDVTLSISSISTLTTGNLAFTTLTANLAADTSYLSAPQNWTFSTTDNAGMTVTVTTDAGAGVTSWDMVSGGNNIEFVLLVDKSIVGAADPFAGGTAAGSNAGPISGLGGRLITPNTTPNPDQNILYDKGADSTAWVYQTFAAIEENVLTTTVEGNYSKTLAVTLTEK